MNSLWTAFSRPVLSRVSSSTGAIPPTSISKIALLVATALTLGSTTAAFVGKNNQHPIKQKPRGKRTDPQSWSQFSINKGWRLPPFPHYPLSRPQSVTCEAVSLPIDDNDNCENIHALPTADELASSPDRYERINPPARMNEHSHAVASLLQPGKIETYEIYRNRVVASASTKEIVTVVPNSSPDRQNLHHRHIVTALVHFGDSLDGHPGIVHGGILALALDDIFGFSFHAIGVPMAFTANLSLDYRTSLPADSSVLIHVFLKKRENRKLYFKADVTSLDGEVLYTESSCLYIVPRAYHSERKVIHD